MSTYRERFRTSHLLLAPTRTHSSSSPESFSGSASDLEIGLKFDNDGGNTDTKGCPTVVV